MKNNLTITKKYSENGENTANDRFKKEIFKLKKKNYITRMSGMGGEEGLGAGETKLTLKIIRGNHNTFLKKRKLSKN